MNKPICSETNAAGETRIFTPPDGQDSCFGPPPLPELKIVTPGGIVGDGIQTIPAPKAPPQQPTPPQTAPQPKPPQDHKPMAGPQPPRSQTPSGPPQPGPSEETERVWVPLLPPPGGELPDEPQPLPTPQPLPSPQPGRLQPLPVNVSGSEVERILDGARMVGKPMPLPQEDLPWAPSDIADSYDASAECALKVLRALVGPNPQPLTRAAGELMAFNIGLSRDAADIFRFGLDIAEHGWRGTPAELKRAARLAAILGVPVTQLARALGTERLASKIFLRVVEGAQWKQTFDSFTPESIQLDVSLGLMSRYRAHDSDIAARLGRYASFERPATPAEAIRNNALAPGVTGKGNQASHLYGVKPRAGLQVRGVAQSQGPGYEGGNTQIFVRTHPQGPWASIEEVPYVLPKPGLLETPLQYLKRLRAGVNEAVARAKDGGSK